jgi:hypothetical protein
MRLQIILSIDYYDQFRQLKQSCSLKLASFNGYRLVFVISYQCDILYLNSKPLPE